VGIRADFFSLMLAGCACSALSACSAPSPDQNGAKRQPLAGAEEETGCVAPVRTEAFDAPEKHAWDLFLAAVHPAKDPKVARGEPDCAKPVGAQGTTSVWETWRLARTEVFLPDGAEPPAWEDMSLPSGYLGRTPDSELKLGEKPGQKIKGFDPEKDQSIFVDHGGIGETRMNKATYTFIKDNCLWSFDGLSRYAKAVVDGKKPPISLPVESQEVKAVWIEFTPADLQAGREKTYYHIVHDGKTYGMTSFHILTKDLPNWFWATFHHSDTPHNPDEVKSNFPLPDRAKNTVWANYVLGGTQADFVTPIGTPTVLSDYYIEYDFTKSSCMTCHASAKGHPEPPRGPDGKLLRDDRGRIVASLEGPLQTVDLGVPKATAFMKNGKPYFIQTDFLWSIPFRAREEKTPPPNRCLL
jgi:hypothetical protein